MSAASPVSGPHTHDGGSVARTMRAVVLALLPALLFGLYHFGWSAVHLLWITVASALLCEAFCLWAAGKAVRAPLLDGSALLTALLLAMSLPPAAPWWIGVLGGVLAVGLGKHIFGGLGQNVFNPAMLARVALLVAFPLEMTTWSAAQPLFAAGAAGPGEGLRVTLGLQPLPDTLTGATVLGHLKTSLGQGIAVPEALAGTYALPDAAVGLHGGSLGETSALLLLAGGTALVGLRVVPWTIPVAMLATVAALAAGFHYLDPTRYAAPGFHLLTGGVMLGAFFIATDPVTSPSGRGGQLLFGAGCGLLVYVIRHWGGYPEGVAFAVLLMNAVTPLIDHYLRPRIYGRTRGGTPLPPGAPGAGR